MENLRKYLGWAFLGLLGLGALFIAIDAITDIGDVFKHGFDSGKIFFYNTLPYILGLVGYILVVVLAVLAALKLLKSSEGVEGKGALLVCILAAVEVISAFFTLLMVIDADMVDFLPGKFWALFIITILVVVALLVRKFAFKDNAFVGNIILAACALAMFIVYIVAMDGIKGLPLVGYIFLFLGCGVVCGVGVLGLLKK